MITLKKKENKCLNQAFHEITKVPQYFLYANFLNHKCVVAVGY